MAAQLLNNPSISSRTCFVRLVNINGHRITFLCHFLFFQDIEEEEDGGEDFYKHEEYDEMGQAMVNGEETDEYSEDVLLQKEKMDVAKLIDDLYKLDYEDLIGQSVVCTNT